MIDPDAISEARRALGRQLAALREANGLNQHELAPRINYGRSTIASAETGYSQCSRIFWKRCDETLSAGGVLVQGYDRLKELMKQHRVEEARRLEREVADGIRRASQQWHHPRTYGPVEAGPAGLDERVAGYGHAPTPDATDGIVGQADRQERLVVTSLAHLDEIYVHLTEQWHALVKTDNLFGPRFALSGVLNHLGLIKSLLPGLRDTLRREFVTLAARYAESAAWLYEDAGDLQRSRLWTGRAMEWAYEADDKIMLAWTMARRSQQAAAVGDAGQVISLARAAFRNEEQLPAPMRAAIRVLQAHGYALDGDSQAAQRLFDEAQSWAANDTVGDARGGHGSYCTAGYIEVHRADCWLVARQPKRAIKTFERVVPTLPVVYQRDRAAALSGLALAYAADGRLEEAAATAGAVLPVARGTGSRRILGEIANVGVQLGEHRSLPAVAALLDDLDQGDR